MDFTDVFEEVFLKNNGHDYSEYAMYLVTAITYGDDHFFKENETLDDEEKVKKRGSTLWLDAFKKFLRDNQVPEACIDAGVDAILDAVDYLRPIEVS